MSYWKKLNSIAIYLYTDIHMCVLYDVNLSNLLLMACKEGIVKLRVVYQISCNERD